MRLPSLVAPRRAWSPDNLKTGVQRSDLYDPQLNRSYGELAESTTAY
jgi:hypothetical protein